jgi:hypothetical protein
MIRGTHKLLRGEVVVELIERGSVRDLKSVLTGNDSVSELKRLELGRVAEKNGAQHAG